MTFLRRAVLSAALAAPSLLAGQSADFAPILLQLPASARALGMGNVAVAGRDDDVLFYNPAQLVAARGMSISMERFSSTASAGALSAVARFNTGGIAVGAMVAEFDTPFGAYPIARRDLLAGGPVAGSSASLVFGIAQVFKSTRVGGSVKFVEERVSQTRSSRTVFDLGLGRDFFGYQFGLAVQNIGQSLPRASPPGSEFVLLGTRMPLRTTFGAMRGWTFGEFDVFGTAAVSTLRDGFVAPAAGGEIWYSWLSGYNVILRAGARRPERGEGAVTGGAGFGIDRLSIDYALETLRGSRFAHRVGLRIR